MRGRDFEEFVALCRDEARPFFDQKVSLTVTRAPGRIDAMGGVADYSGSTVLEGTIADAAFIALQPRSDDVVRVWSDGAEREGFKPRVERRLRDLTEGQHLRSCAEVNALLSAEPLEAWAAYIIGAYYVLAREGAAPVFTRGANILLKSTVPLGGGVSSSAAIEVAAMHAVCHAHEIQLDPLRLATLCQTVENRVVGAACGIMDQVTIALGEEGSLLALRCQPHDVLGNDRLPETWRISGINSCVKHRVGGYRYPRARCAAFMGRKIIETHLGEDSTRGYLCNVTLAEYRDRCLDLVPAETRGDEFLARYGDTDDPMTSPVPDMEYPVEAGAEHAIHENHRVNEFRRLMQQAGDADEQMAVHAGDLMYGSHASYGRIGLGCEECDLLVSLGQQRGPEQGIHGAKISGGGCGGTVVFLTSPEGEGVLPEIAADYEAQTGIRAQVIQGTSPGALQWGVEAVEV